MIAIRPTLHLLALALVASACAGDTGAEPTPSPTPTGDDTIQVAIASYDLAVGAQQRVIAGLLTSDRRLVAGGDAEFTFFHLVEGEDPAPVATVPAAFLPVPGKEPAEPLAEPVLVTDADTTGVFAAHIDLDRAGFWGLHVAVTLGTGEVLSGTASFAVADDHSVPAVGEAAPTTDNPTLDSDVPVMWLDSCAQPAEAEDPCGVGQPDTVKHPHLHQTSIADAIAAGEPVVAVFSTPVYCASRFCGPITDTIADLGETYGDRATFVHVEVWRDFSANQLNEAAAEWIITPAGGQEPWVFVIDGEGTIQGRWDNVLDLQELVSMLEALPVL